MNLEDVCVVVTSRNDAATIGSCLESTRGFGSVVVVDAFSVDRTAEIARDAGAVVYSRPLNDAAAQKNWAVTRAPGRWVLSVDATETLSDELRDSIGKADGDGADGYEVRIANEYLGRVMKSGAASFDGAVRLFTREAGEFVPDGGDPSGASLATKGRTGVLGGAVLRREFRDVHLHFEAINRTTTAEARRYVEGGGRLAPLRMLLQPTARFWRLFVFRGGIRDGARGMMYCMLCAYASFITYAKAWEIRSQNRRDKKQRGKDAA